MTSEFVFEKRSITLLIEWDGNRPPTQWYSRLHKLGIFVRGNKELSPLARRDKQNGNLTLQEGAIVCDSESQAKTLGLLAEKLGAVNVAISYSEIVPLTMTLQDRKALDRVQMILGKRGRPEPNRDMVVTCHNCGHSHNYVGRDNPNCPTCGSFVVVTRPGSKVKLSLDANARVFDNWVRSRFSTKSYEEPEYNTEFPLPDVDVAGIVLGEQNIIAALTNSTLIAEIWKSMQAGLIDLEKALRLIDAGYLTLKKDGAIRLTNRIHAITDFIKAGGKEDGLILCANEKDVDLFDIADIERSALYLRAKL